MSRFCAACGRQLANVSTQPIGKGEQTFSYAKGIGAVVGFAIFLFLFTWLGDAEEHGTRIRMNAGAWLLYGLGGKFLLSAIAGIILGFFSFMLFNKKK
jgi:hypothetical protein